MTKKIALLFAGAGASTAVDREQYPTTVRFYERLPVEFKKKEIPKSVETWFKSVQGSESAVMDIEVLLWALEDLERFLRDMQESNSFSFSVLRDDSLTQWTKGSQANPRPSVAQIIRHYGQLIPQVSQLRQHINGKVYDFYSKLPQHEQLKENWLLLLAEVIQAGFSIELVTTNYDLVIEQALEFTSWSEKPSTGRSGSSLYPFLDIDLWRSPLQSNGLLTKLHGSIDWSYHDSKILVGNPLNKARDSSHAIIYPGFKGIPQAEEMLLFHNYFAQAISNASCLIFVGFAFRDSYINDLLQANVSPDAEIIVLNPASAIPDMPFRGRAKHVPFYFDKEGVAEVTKLLIGESRDAKKGRLS